MVVRRMLPSSNAILRGNDANDVSQSLEVSSFTEYSSQVPWRNTFNMRALTLTTMANGRPSSRFSNSPLNKMRCRLYTGAHKSLDLLRVNLQSAINREIDMVIQRYLEKFFQPAVRNIRDNLGYSSVNEELIKEVCRNVLDDAKQMYNPSCSPVTSSQRVTSTTATSPHEQERRDFELDDTEEGTFNYPPLVKWNPARVNKDTQFILSTSASKVLGLGPVRGRFGLKHPELVRYMADQDDKEWLSTARVPGVHHGVANVSLMFLEDIIQIANSNEYKNTPLCLSELQGFVVPDFIQRKIRAYMTLMRTKYLPSSSSDSPEVQMSTGVECVSSSVSLSVKDSDVIELDQCLSQSSGDEAD